MTLRLLLSRTDNNIYIDRFPAPLQRSSPGIGIGEPDCQSCIMAILLNQHNLLSAFCMLKTTVLSFFCDNIKVYTVLLHNKNTIRDTGNTALYTTLFTLFTLFKLLYTAKTLAGMPMPDSVFSKKWEWCAWVSGWVIPHIRL